MESTDVAGSDELGRLDRRITAESDSEVLIALKRRRQLAQIELTSQRNNPELGPIMQSSAASAVLSITTPLPAGHARLTGPVSPTELDNLQQQASCAARIAASYERRVFL